MPFAQLILGPPGSGKSTYCEAIHHFLTNQPEESRRNVYIVNLDPANDHLRYPCQVDIMDLISVEDCMESLQLGPNGALIYCMQFLLENKEWLVDSVRNCVDWEDAYWLIDMPGQVELFTTCNHLRSIVEYMQSELQMRFCMVQLMDSVHCRTLDGFLSILILGIQTMMYLELPCISILSKVDTMRANGSFIDGDPQNDLFNLDFYLDPSAEHLLALLEQKSDDNPQYKKLNAALCSFVEDFAYLSFYPLAVNDMELLAKAMRAIDRASGYIFHGDISEVIVKNGLLEDHSDLQHRTFESKEDNTPSVLMNAIVEHQTDFIR